MKKHAWNLVLFVAATLTVAAEATGRPNALLILADDSTFCGLALPGCHPADTPPPPMGGCAKRAGHQAGGPHRPCLASPRDQPRLPAGDSGVAQGVNGPPGGPHRARGTKP